MHAWCVFFDTVEQLNSFCTGVEEEHLYQEAIKNDRTVSLRYLKLLLLGPGQVGKSTFLRRLLGEMKWDIDSDPKPHCSTEMAHLQQVCVKYTLIAAAVTTDGWHTIEESMLVNEQLHVKEVGTTKLTESQRINNPEEVSHQHQVQCNSHSSALPLTSTQERLGATTSTDNLKLDYKYQQDTLSPNIANEYEELGHNLKLKPQILIETLLNIVDVGGQPAFLNMLPSLTIGPAMYLVFMKLLDGLGTEHPVEITPDVDTDPIVCKEYTYTSEDIIFTALSSIACFGNSDAGVEASDNKSNKFLSSIALLLGTFTDEYDEYLEATKEVQLVVDRNETELKTRLKDTGLHNIEYYDREKRHIFLNKNGEIVTYLEEFIPLFEKLIINISITPNNSPLLMGNYNIITLPDLSVSHLVTETRSKEETKSKKKKSGFVPPRRQIFLLLKRRCKRKIRGKQSALKAQPLSDSEDDKNLPGVVQEKSLKTLKSRMQIVTISRYSDPPKLKGHVSAKLAYLESDSNSQEEDIGNRTDIFASDQCSSVKMDLVHNSQYSYSKEPVAQTMQALLSMKGTAIFRVGAPSTELEFKRLRVSVNVQAFYLLIKREKSAIVTYISTENKQELYCFENRGLGRKKKPVYRVTSEAETLYDFSKSAIVHGSFSKRNLVVIKELETPKSNFVGIPSHEKLSQSNIRLVDHISTSETSSQQLYSSATYERTDSMRLPTLAAANSLSTSSPPVAAESPVKSKGVRGRVQVDGEQKASLNASIARASTIRTSERTRERNSPRENDSSLQRSIPTRRSPDWIAIATKLLHVPDYQKMIQILNGVTPAQEDVVAHKFIKGIAYFKVGKLRQAMDDLHECEKFALESIEDERRAHSQRQLDSGVFSMQPGSQASPQASSLQYLQQSSKKGDVAVCNVYMGDLHYTSSSYLEASKCYQRAADLYDRECVARLFRMVPPTISTIHSKCGSCLRNLSKSMEAIQEYRNAIETAIRDKDRLAAHTSLGNLQQTLGQNKEALVEYEHALDLAETLNEHMSVGWTHGNIGNAFLGLNEKDKALFHLQKALDITIKYEPKPDSIGRAYNNLGTAYQSMGDLDKAEEHYDLALSQAIYGNDPAGQSRVYGNIGNIYIVRKRFEKAIPHYTEVLRLSKDEATISTAHHNRGCALYEWAESKMLALEQSLQKNSSSNEPTFRFHGSQTTLPQKHSPRIVIDSIAKLFRDGMSDLQKVAETHEAKLDHIKGSAKGLSLSVSLTESNSRTFHRLQDCMVAIGNWREALLIAEQSRARTLGEIMLARKESQLEKALTSPLNLEHVYSIVSSQKSPVLYLTHTGASLFGWVLVPAEDSDSISIEMFEIPISDDQFNGKSFDYHIRYGLTEVLVEQSYEMYCSIDYDEETTAPVAQLFKVIGKPFQMTLDRLLPGNKKAKMQKIVLITDTYTSLLPFTCMYDPDSETFLGDHYYFETMQSLLTMGIMNQLPEPMVELPADPQSMCIVGNPIIPKFYLNGEVWSLGKLPYARREAQWVGHILNTPPILDEQATKSAVVMRFMRAKVIHIATHGSSVSGFLAFASLTSTRQGEGVDSSGVLLHPEEVEKLSISPALVVLSSCDSSRGTVKADGVQGMARAFLLAGMYTMMYLRYKYNT